MVEEMQVDIKKKNRGTKKEQVCKGQPQDQYFYLLQSFN